MVALRHLRAFVAVAEELHFTRAAARVFMTQPALTHQIKRLEADLGVRLLDRTSRRVALTAEGQLLLTLSRDVLGTLDQGLAALRASTHPQTLRIGYTDYLGYTPVPEALRTYAQAHPEVTFQHVEGSTQEQLAQLAAGTLDVGFFVAERVDVPGVRSSRLWHEPLRLALPDGHPLTALEQVPLQALDGEPLLVNSPDSNPLMYAFLQSVFRRSGVQPRWVVNPLPRMHSFGGVMRLVAEGAGAYLIVRAMGQVPYPGVQFRAVEPEPRLPFRMAWRLGLSADTSGALLRTLRAHLNQERASG